MSVSILLPSMFVFSMLVTYGLATSRLEVQQQQRVELDKHNTEKSSSSGNCGGHLEEVEKCMSDIMDQIMRAQFLNIGQPCCRVVAEISQDCNYIKILPFDPLKDPFWGPLLTDYCTATP